MYACCLPIPPSCGGGGDWQPGPDWAIVHWGSIIDIIITHARMMSIYKPMSPKPSGVSQKNSNGQSFAVSDFLLVCFAGDPGNRFGGGCPTVPNFSPVAPLSLSDMFIHAVLKSGVPSCQEPGAP